MRNTLIAFAASCLLLAPTQVFAQEKTDPDQAKLCVIWAFTIAQCALGDMEACSRIPPEAAHCT